MTRTTEPITIRDRVRELRRVKASELVPHKRNWRIHPPGQKSALQGILADIGYADVLIARELPDGRLGMIDGHLRAETTPEMEVPVIVVDLNEEEADKLLLTLDPLAGMAERDDTAIAELLKRVNTDNEAVRGLLDTLSKGIAGPPLQEPPAQIDKAAELQKKWGTETGQIWNIAGHRLFCGDSRFLPEGFFAGHEIRLIWTDPPYGVSYGAKNEFLNAISRGNRIQTPIDNDQLSAEQIKALVVAALRVVLSFAEPGIGIYLAAPPGPLHIEFINALNEAGFTYKHQLVWVKQQFVIGRSDYHYRHEPILYGWRENGPHLWAGNHSQDSVFEISKPHISDLHPTTKPVELIARMIANSSNIGDLIYDPFVGSGTTLLAAHQLNRIGYGIEIDPGYCAVALQRLADLGLTPKLINLSPSINLS